MNPHLYFSLGRDTNGHRTLKVAVSGFRSFSVQTCGNLPSTHRYGINQSTSRELWDHIKKVGTKNQKDAVAAIPQA